MITRLFPALRLGFTTLLLILPIAATAASAQTPTGRAPTASAATDAAIRGRVTHHDTQEPIAGARVLV
jgi:hypothetical protein